MLTVNVNTLILSKTKNQAHLPKFIPKALTAFISSQKGKIKI